MYVPIVNNVQKDYGTACFMIEIVQVLDMLNYNCILNKFSEFSLFIYKFKSIKLYNYCFVSATVNLQIFVVTIFRVKFLRGLIFMGKHSPT